MVMRNVLAGSYVVFFALMCCVFTIPGQRNDNVQEMSAGLQAVMCTLGPVAALLIGLVFGRSNK